MMSMTTKDNARIMSVWMVLGGGCVKQNPGTACSSACSSAFSSAFLHLLTKDGQVILFDVLVEPIVEG